MQREISTAVCVCVCQIRTQCNLYSPYLATRVVSCESVLPPSSDKCWLWAGRGEQQGIFLENDVQEEALTKRDINYNLIYPSDPGSLLTCVNIQKMLFDHHHVFEQFSYVCLFKCTAPFESYNIFTRAASLVAPYPQCAIWFFYMI